MRPTPVFWLRTSPALFYKSTKQKNFLIHFQLKRWLLAKIDNR